MNITRFLFLVFLVFIFYIPRQSIYAENLKSCTNRYVTIVNPIRGRNLWFEKSLKPLNDQYQIIQDNDLYATWLLQYDVLKDDELLQRLKEFDGKQELGVFLEISQSIADQARVIYPYDSPWFSPRAVFLSSYTQSERRKLIDTLFKDFKSSIGYFPKSVGAWWIDSYSLNYLKEKYNIRTALIVADQLTTDNYGVWGQWWGVPYYPSKLNILAPASSLSNKLDTVIIQWAQRDPTLAYGESPLFSNYSLQANDYIRQGKDTRYSQALANIYLDCQNPLGQITVGLETGIESVGYIDEYRNQVNSLKSISNLQSVTMAQFADKFASVYPDFPQHVKLGESWNFAKDYRENKKLGDYIKYNQELSFADYFIADKQLFLNRNLAAKILPNSPSFFFPWYLLVLIGLGVLSFLRKEGKLWLIGTLFLFTAFGLVFRSTVQHGWNVYYGSNIWNVNIVQPLIVLIIFLLMYFLVRRYKTARTYLYLLPLSFAFDPLVQAARITLVSGKYYLGFMVDTFRFIGVSFSKPFSFGLVSFDFPAYQAAALLRFDFNKVWDNLFFSLFLYPLAHVVFAIALGFILVRLPVRAWKVIVSVLVILTIIHLGIVFNADPRLVTPLS